MQNTRYVLMCYNVPHQGTGLYQQEMFGLDIVFLLLRLILYFCILYIIFLCNILYFVYCISLTSPVVMSRRPTNTHTYRNMSIVAPLMYVIVL